MQRRVLIITQNSEDYFALRREFRDWTFDFRGDEEPIERVGQSLQQLRDPANFMDYAFIVVSPPKRNSGPTMFSLAKSFVDNGKIVIGVSSSHSPVSQARAKLRSDRITHVVDTTTQAIVKLKELIIAITSSPATSGG